MTTTFGKNLERLRKDKKVSQTELGKLLGLTQQMISSYENNTSTPNLDVLCVLADYFKVSIDSLVGHVVQTDDTTTTQESRLLQYYSSLTSIDQDKCMTIIQTILQDRNH